MDRYPESPCYGTVQSEVIYLRRKVGQLLDGGNLTGALKHGSVVTVKDKDTIDGQDWYYVEGSATHEGEVYPQVGWCPAKMLRKRGRDAYR